MNGRDRSNRSGDTVPPDVLGRNRAVEEALSELTVGLEPGEDALFVGPDWAQRDAVRTARDRTTQRMDAAELAAARAAPEDPEQAAQERPATETSPELRALYQAQLITIRTRTIGQQPANFAGDEFDDISSQNSESRRPAGSPAPDSLAPAAPTTDRRRVAPVPWSRAIALILPSVALAVLMVWLGLRSAGQSGNREVEISPAETSAAVRSTGVPQLGLAPKAQPSVGSTAEVSPAASAPPSAASGSASSNRELVAPAPTSAIPAPTPDKGTYPASPATTRPAPTPAAKPAATFEPFGEGL